MKRKKGGQTGNRNACCHGAPKGNRNAWKHGAYSVIISDEEMQEISGKMPAEITDLYTEELFLLTIRERRFFMMENRYTAPLYTSMVITEERGGTATLKIMEANRDYMIARIAHALTALQAVKLRAIKALADYRTASRRKDPAVTDIITEIVTRRETGKAKAHIPPAEGHDK